MGGVRNGIQALMEKEADNCLCPLLCTQLESMCPRYDEEVRITAKLHRVKFIFQLVKLIKFSLKRLNLFEGVRKNITLSDGESAMSPLLRTLCPTRWTVRHSAIDSILKNYQALMSMLEVVQQGHDEYAAKGKGLLMKMESLIPSSA